MMTFNHGFSGYVCAKVAEPLARRYAPVSARLLVFAVFLGAMFPDLDIITRIFGKNHYFGNTWYAHRHFTHSIFGTLVLALVAAGVVLLLLRRSGKLSPRVWQTMAWCTGAFWFGGLLHIFGDLFTPGWQMPVFWPHPARFGGFRQIGWFTPYLLWLFLATLLLSWVLPLLFARHARLAPWSRHAVWLVNLLAVYRWVQFIAISRYESWDQWLALQRDLLPEPMVTPVTATVRAVWNLFSP